MKVLSNRGIIGSLCCLHIIFTISVLASNVDEEDDLLDEVIPHHLAKRRFHSPSKRQFIQTGYDRSRLEQLAPSNVEQFIGSNEQLPAGIPDQSVSPGDQDVAGPGQLDQSMTQSQPSDEQMIEGNGPQEQGFSQQLTQADAGAPHTLLESTKNYDPNSVTEMSLNDNNAYKVTTDAKEKANHLASEVKDYGLGEYTYENAAPSTDQTAKILQNKLFELDKNFQGKDSASLNVNQIANAQGSMVDNLLDLFNNKDTVNQGSIKAVDSIESDAKGLEAYDSATKGYSALDMKGNGFVTSGKNLGTGSSSSSSNIDTQGSDFTPTQQEDSPSDVSVVNLSNNYSVEDEKGNDLGTVGSANTAGKQNHASKNLKLMKLMKALLKQKLRAKAARLWMKTKGNNEALSPLKRIAKLLSKPAQQQQQTKQSRFDGASIVPSISNTDLKLLSYIKNMLNKGNAGREGQGISEEQMKFFMTALKETVDDKDASSDAATQSTQHADNKKTDRNAEDKQAGSKAEEKGKESKFEKDESKSEEKGKESKFGKDESKSEEKGKESKFGKDESEFEGKGKESKFGKDESEFEKTEPSSSGKHDTNESNEKSKEKSKSNQLSLGKLKAIKDILKQVKPTSRSGSFSSNPNQFSGNTGATNTNTLEKYLEHETSLVDQFQEGSEIGDPAKQLKHLAHMMLSIANKAKDNVVEARRTTPGTKHVSSTVKSTLDGGKNEYAANEGGKKESESSDKKKEESKKGDSGDEQKESRKNGKEREGVEESKEGDKGKNELMKEDNASKVKEDNGSKVKEDNDRKVKEDNGSKFKEDNASKVKEDNASKVKEDNASKVKEDNAGKVKEDNASKVKDDSNKNEREDVKKEGKQSDKDDELKKMKKIPEVEKLKNNKKIVPMLAKNEESENKDGLEKTKESSNQTESKNGEKLQALGKLPEVGKLRDNKKVVSKVNDNDEKEISENRITQSTKQKEDKSDKDKNDKDKSDMDKSEKDKSDMDKSDMDKSDRNKSDKDKTTRETDNMSSNNGNKDNMVSSSSFHDGDKAGQIKVSTSDEKKGIYIEKTEQKNQTISDDLNRMQEGQQKERAKQLATGHAELRDNEKEDVKPSGHISPGKAAMQSNSSMPSSRQSHLTPQLPFLNPGKAHLDVLESDQSLKQYLLHKGEKLAAHNNQNLSPESFDNNNEDAGKLLHVKDVTGTAKARISGTPGIAKTAGHAHAQIPKIFTHNARPNNSFHSQNLVPPAGQGFPWDSKAHGKNAIRPISRMLLKKYKLLMSHMTKPMLQNQIRVNKLESGGFKHIGPALLSQLNDASVRYAALARLIAMAKNREKLIDVTASKKSLPDKPVYLRLRNETGKSRPDRISVKFYRPLLSSFFKKPEDDKDVLVPTSKLDNHEKENAVLVPEKQHVEEEPAEEKSRLLSRGKSAEIDTIVDPADVTRSQLEKPKKPAISQVLNLLAGEDSAVKSKPSKTTPRITTMKGAKTNNRKLTESGSIKPVVHTRINPIGKPQQYLAVHDEEYGKGFIRKNNVRDIIRTIKGDVDAENFLLRKRSEIPRITSRKKNRRFEW
eukprot:gene18203-20021_t